MDNAAFRSLVSKPKQDGTNSSPANTFRKPAALGSRMRSSIPMTPRNVPGYNSNRDFARQVAEHTSSTGEPPLKKFKSSAVPKGAKFGAGYVDRAQLRKGEEQETDSNDDKAARLKNLEEQLKLGQIELAQFEQLRDQIGVGGDVGSTHLIKGLDWKLLAKVRRGEDINASAEKEEDNEQDKVDVDEELERALEKDVVAIKTDETDEETHNTQSPAQVLTRDEILRRFREQRNGPVAPAAPVLDGRFKKVAAPEKSGKKKYVESVNGRRREVLVITKKDGTTKRKTRWIDAEDMTKPEQQPLGMEVPAEMAAKHKAMLEAEAAEDENDDIFADAGNDYDPLAGIASSDDEASEGEHTETARPVVPSGNQKRNYFSTGKEEDNEKDDVVNKAPNDPTIMAALKRAAQIRQREEGNEGSSGGLGTNEADTEAGAKSSAFLAKLKEQERQDAADLDYGFGEDRFGDDDDDEAGPLYDDEEGEGKKKSAGRKRGPKKRKGNKDNVQDVMSVMEGRNKK